MSAAFDIRAVKTRDKTKTTKQIVSLLNLFTYLFTATAVSQAVPTTRRLSRISVSMTSRLMLSFVSVG